MAVQCHFQGCNAQVPEGVAPLHALDHLTQTVREMVQHQLQEPLKQLDQRLQHLDQRIQGMAPVHGTLETVLESAEVCPECHKLAVEFAQALREKPQSDSGAKPQPAAVASPAPTPAEPAPAPKPMTFAPEDIDWLGLEAFGLRPVETDEGVVITADDDSSLEEAVEAGLLPQGCTAKVGPDGQTKYVCPR